MNKSLLHLDVISEAVNSKNLLTTSVIYVVELAITDTIPKVIKQFHHHSGLNLRVISVNFIIHKIYDSYTHKPYATAWSI